MSFGIPDVFWALLLVPVLVLAYVILRGRPTRYAIRFTQVDVLAEIATVVPRWRRYLPTALFALALLSLLIGMARPRATVLLPREEASIVLALDASGSMQATDVEPSRLHAAREAAQNFVSQLPPKFQVGVVAFADEAEVLAQPTTDRTTVREGIDSLHSGGMTAIGDAIMRSVSLDPRNPSRRNAAPEPDPKPLIAVLLLSDGSNTAGKLEPMEAAARAKARGLPVYTIAFGSAPQQSGSEVPVVAADPPDYETLRNIAKKTGGRYFAAPTQQDLEAIYKSLASRLGFVKDHQEVTFAFAGAGLLLAAASALLAARWNGRLP